MELKLLTLAAIVLCHVTLFHQSEAMYGLCSTDWFTDGCFDNNSECKTLGGVCYHDGHGDHGEGCVCKRKVQRGKFYEFEILTKDHFSDFPFLRPMVRGEKSGKSGKAGTNI